MLDLEYFNKICPDKTGMSKCDYIDWHWHGILQVPVIALFTKFDQFKRDIKMNLEDKLYQQDKLYQNNHPLSEMEIDAKVKSTFKQEYLAHLSGTSSLQFICLECEGFLFFLY